MGCARRVPYPPSLRTSEPYPLDFPRLLPGPHPRAERRRRAAEPALEFIAFCRRRKIPHQSTPQLERAYDAWNAERYERGETDQSSWEAYNPVREARNRPGNWTL
jgi:hypothetical protein